MDKITFGRSAECDIVFDDRSVSRNHGYLLVDGKKVYVVDDNSTNGVYVNGKRIKGKKLLSSRDKVMLAKKFLLDWQDYVGLDNDETILNNDETTMCCPSVSESYSQPHHGRYGLIDIPSRMEINQNHAGVYRNGSEGADWKVPFKRNMGDKIGNAVGETVGCILSILIIMAVIAILAALGGYNF